MQFGFYGLDWHTGVVKGFELQARLIREASEGAFHGG